MKISWVQGVIMFYLLILACEMMATGGTGGTVFTNVATTEQSLTIEPSYLTSGSTASAAWTVATNIGQTLGIIASFLVLWSPTVFSGNLLWVWWFICFPTDVAMIFAILAMVRGVGSG